MNLTGNTINLNFPTLAVSGVSQYNIKTFSRYRITCLKVLTYHLLLNYLGSMGVLSGTNKIIFIYLRPRYYYMYCFQYSSVGRHSVVVLFICNACTTTMLFYPSLHDILLRSALGTYEPVQPPTLPLRSLVLT